MTLTAISLTHVQYPIDGGLFAKGMAYMSLLPIFLIVSFVTLILFRRDLATIVFFVGQLSNEGLNFILKRLIAQERPTRTFLTKFFNELGHLGKGYGMPSSHAQFMTFFSTYFILCFIFRFKMNSLDRGIYIMASLVISIMVSYSRIYLNYHTLEQVLAGSTIGVLVGMTWYVFSTPFMNWMERRLLRHSLAHRLYLKDTRYIDNVLQKEHEAWFTFQKRKK